jgi:hypothetical protein
MTSLRNLMVAGVAALVGMVPLAASGAAEAGPSHAHIGKGHSHGREQHRPMKRLGRPHRVYYRHSPSSPWILAGTWNGDQADRVAAYLRSYGYEVFSR